MKRWPMTDYQRAMRALAAGRGAFPQGIWYVTNEFRNWNVVCTNWSNF